MKNNKTALITGASGGLGESFAQIFAQQGYNLVLVARSEAKMKDIAQKLEAKYHVKIMVLAQDLSQPNSAEKIYNTVKDKDIQIDTLVNNAGFGKIGAFADEPLTTLTEMLNLNITTLTEMTSLFLPKMIERNSGKILNIASTASFQPLPNFGVYAASKAYVLHLTEALHYELQDTNISVTALCPGPVHTGFAKRANAENSILFKHAMTPRAVAEIGYKALINNKVYSVVGFKNKLMIYLSRLLPSRRITANIAKNMY